MRLLIVGGEGARPGEKLARERQGFGLIVEAANPLVGADLRGGLEAERAERARLEGGRRLDQGTVACEVVDDELRVRSGVEFD